MSSPALHRQTRAGYTLLELLLALALSIIVISTIASAIHINLFSLARSQGRIERKQIARSVLAMIGNDIRAAVEFKAVDYSGLENVLLSQQLAAGVPPTPDIDEGEAPDGGDSDDNGDSDDDASLARESLSNVPSSPTFSNNSEDESLDDSESWSIGLIGDANYIWLDISRLPRIDQYHPLIQTTQDAVTTGSDIKQVVYYVGSVAGQSNSGSATRDNRGAQTGLIRDQIDRAVAFYQGGLDPTTPKEFSQLVAAEVVQIGFRYFDGQQWVSQWDSEEFGGFPTAVEVNVVIDSNPVDETPNDPDDFSNRDDGRFESYRSVVHLPLAEFTDEEEDDDQ
jgi:type II secretory pathway pseudopilin PulG